jgi:hypothetical protein
MCEVYIISFWWGFGLFLVSVWENAGMPENYGFLMDYEYPEKKKKIYELKYIVFKIYTLSIRFHKIFFCL